jgi:hypothetical protein
MAIEINRSYDYGEDETAKKIRARRELEKKMKEFLAKGGKVEKIKPGMAKGASGALGGKPQYTQEDLDRDWQNESKRS